MNVSENFDDCCIRFIIERQNKGYFIQIISGITQSVQRYIYSTKSLMVFCKIYIVCDNAIDSLREIRFGISLVKDIKYYHHH